MDASFVEAVEQSCHSSAGRTCAPGGWGGVALSLTLGPPVPSNLHGCYSYIFVYEYMYMQVPPASPPPLGMGSLNDKWGAPLTLRNSFQHKLQHSVYFICSLMCQLLQCVPYSFRLMRLHAETGIK